MRVEVLENPLVVSITFIDRGIPYDPHKQKKANKLNGLLTFFLGPSDWI